MNFFLLLIISRPKFWLYLLGPFLIGTIIGISQIQDVYDPKILLYICYFLFPANFYLYGINDYYDRDTDKYNPRKKASEHFMTLEEKKYVQYMLYITILFSIYVIYMSPYIIKIILLLFILLATGYSMPPLRLKATAFFDSFANSLYVIPGIIGYYYVTTTFPPVQYILGACCWVFAMHLFSAIPDISVDKKANLVTSAIFLGKRNALIVCSILWFIFSMIYIFSFTLLPYTFLLLIYPLIPFIVLFYNVRIEKIYNLFPIINSVIGFFFFLLLFITKFYA